MIPVAVGLIRMDLKLRAEYLDGSLNFISIAKNGADTSEVAHSMKLGPTIDARPTLANLFFNPLAVFHPLDQ
jgi:hypothetical protein